MKGGDTLERIADAKLCIEESKSLLKEITDIYNKNLYKDNLPPNLNIKIKNFLDNIRSSLDYVSNYIFYNYCYDNYTKKELERIERQIYFPSKKSEPAFNDYISRRFKGLSSQPKILKLFAEVQVFSGVDWAKNLVLLSNKNKHIKFTKHTRSESAHITYMKDIFGTEFKNCTFQSCGTAIQYNDVSLSSIDIKSNPYIISFLGNIDVEYKFKDTDTPLIPTLENIINGAENFISDLENLI